MEFRKRLLDDFVQRAIFPRLCKQLSGFLFLIAEAFYVCLFYLLILTLFNDEIVPSNNPVGEFAAYRADADSFQARAPHAWFTPGNEGRKTGSRP